jgi:hypothetical protein
LKTFQILIIIALIGIISISAFYLISNSNESEIGVEVGNWIEYDAILTEFDPHDSSVINTEKRRIKIEFVEVQERNLVLNVTYSYLDGNTIISQMIGKLGENNFEGFIIPANLNVGDTFSEASEEFSIIEMENQIIKAKSRQIIISDISPMGGMKSYWDQKTGVLVRASQDTYISSYELRTIDTNLW